MNASARLGNVTPLIPAGDDLDKAVLFYERLLGFKKTYQDEGMAIVKRDDASLFLIKSDDRHWAENTSLRIRTDNLDALYDSYQAEKMGDEHLKPLKEPPWGTKEFTILDLAGVCITFYENL